VRWMTTLATAGLAEAAASFLGLTWGFMVLLAAFVVVAVRVSGAMAAASSKGASTEARLAAHIVAAAPAISLVANGGTIGGTVFVSGDHHVTGNQGVTGSQTVTGQINGSTLSMSGGATVSGFTSHGNIAADNDVQVGGNLTGPTGGTVDTAGIHSNGTILADVNVECTDLFVNSQRVAPGQGRPAFYPVVVSGSTSINSIDTALNQIVGCLVAAGISA
jgi:hypothetical protein